MRELGTFISGEWRQTNAAITVRSPFDGREVARVARASAGELRAALEAAAAAREPMASLSPNQRAAILEKAAAEVARRRDELAGIMVEEAGKPIALSRVEADRCVETFAESARVARSPHGELLDLEGFPSGAGRTGVLRRFPVGVVVGITPFNFPLNLVAHKLAPAVAAGCPIVLKPASQTPSHALVLAEILHEAGVPAGGVNVVPCGGADAGTLLDDARVRLVTFTGSAAVGWELKCKAWDRKVALELGGNAAVVVEPDGGDLAAVAHRVAIGAYSYAGQSCISVQRVLVNQEIAGAFTEALVAAAAAVPTGDPAAKDTVCGPMITAGDADRIEKWIGEAERLGARCLNPRRREGSVVWPLVLDRVPDGAALWSEEAFAPVAAIRPYREFEEALALVNDSRFGLQAGVFTRDVEKVQRAFAALEVGAVIQGDIPSWRSDPMPYGGVKQSGVGREGPRYAVEEMTEPRLLVVRRG
ncbi:MAG TPA: aldehyde dehydrogenase family protein [Thermoanaerobaculaceae bacterium]|nr:aldehyde dehydrogenase family protein [Thermoanaerobaculaceae bacterium]